MCGCSKLTRAPLLVNGVNLYYSNYLTFEYVDEAELVMLKKQVITPIFTRTIFGSNIELTNFVPYTLVSREEADELLKMVKKKVQYFAEITSYQINELGIVEEVP